MPAIGYCEECRCYLPVDQLVGGCQNGHPRSCLRDVRESGDLTQQGLRDGRGAAENAAVGAPVANADFVWRTVPALLGASLYVVLCVAGAVGVAAISSNPYAQSGLTIWLMLIFVAICMVLHRGGLSRTRRVLAVPLAWVVHLAIEVALQWPIMFVMAQVGLLALAGAVNALVAGVLVVVYAMRQSRLFVRRI